MLLIYHEKGGMCFVSNITYIPGPTSTEPTTAHQVPGVPFLGNDLYQPLHQPMYPYDLKLIATPGVPARDIRLVQSAQTFPHPFYPPDVGAPSPDLTCRY